jgi:hypothetical protein
MSKSLNAHDVVMTKKLTSQFCCRPVDVPVGREQLHVLQHQVSCLQLNLRLSQGNNSSSILTFNILAFDLLGLLLRLSIKCKKSIFVFPSCKFVFCLKEYIFVNCAFLLRNCHIFEVFNRSFTSTSSEPELSGSGMIFSRSGP